MKYTQISAKLGFAELDDFYPNIRGNINEYNAYTERPGYETSLVATARMLFNDDRLAAHSSKMIQLVVEKRYFESYRKGGVLNEDFFFEGSNVTLPGFSDGLCMILMPDRNYNDVIECIRGLEAAFANHGWKVLSDVSKYIDNHDNVIVFQNAESHANVLFAPLTEYVKVTHLVASVMTRLFPWCFEISPVTTDELVLLRTLFNQDDAEFIRITDARYNELNLYEAYLKNSIGNFCNTDYEDTISRLRSTISSSEDAITDYFGEIKRLRDEIEANQAKIIMYRNKAYDEKDINGEVIDYLLNNKSLIFLGLDGTRTMRIGVNCFMDDCDIATFKTNIENVINPEHSYLYNVIDCDYEVMKRFYQAVWKNHRFNLRVYCEWELNCNGRAEPCSGSRMGNRKELIENRMPHPHLDRFGCCGGYKDVIYKLSMEHDFIGVLDTIVASSHGINFSDSTVTEYMLAFLNHHLDEKLFEDKSGNLYSFKEIIGIIAEEIKVEKEHEVNGNNSNGSDSGSNGNNSGSDSDNNTRRVQRTQREHARRTA